MGRTRRRKTSGSASDVSQEEAEDIILDTPRPLGEARQVQAEPRTHEYLW